MITVYTTSLSANLSMKKKCDEIIMYLQGQKVGYEAYIDPQVKYR